ncbi:uncharacterized protein [Mytilus edulis]|uniref:uncharacterized protein n=1 Tax=Mytilus edulis TaxID=6550 RepID=UPI0039EFE035
MNDSENESNKEDKCIPRFKKKSEWNLPRSKNDNLEPFISSIKTEVKSSVSGKRLRNPSEQESQAINNLESRDDIVIKQADKGSAVVVINKTDYIEEGNRQLSNTKFYKHLKSDPTKEISKQINEILSDMNSKKHIDEDTYDYLRPDETYTAGRFYLLPDGNPTKKISEFVDYNLRPHVRTMLSYIQDTTDYLKKMDSLNPLPILVSMDVSS